MCGENMAGQSTRAYTLGAKIQRGVLERAAGRGYKRWKVRWSAGHLEGVWLQDAGRLLRRVFATWRGALGGCFWKLLRKVPGNLRAGRSALLTLACSAWGALLKKWRGRSWSCSRTLTCTCSLKKGSEVEFRWQARNTLGQTASTWRGTTREGRRRTFNIWMQKTSTAGQWASRSRCENSGGRKKRQARRRSWQKKRAIEMAECWKWTPSTCRSCKRCTACTCLRRKNRSVSPAPQPKKQKCLGQDEGRVRGGATKGGGRDKVKKFIPWKPQKKKKNNQKGKGGRRGVIKGVVAKGKLARCLSVCSPVLLHQSLWQLQRPQQVLFQRQGRWKGLASERLRGLWKFGGLAWFGI